jgi:monoamine oxidase
MVCTVKYCTRVHVYCTFGGFLKVHVLSPGWRSLPPRTLSNNSFVGEIDDGMGQTPTTGVAMKLTRLVRVLVQVPLSTLLIHKKPSTTTSTCTIRAMSLTKQESQPLHVVIIGGGLSGVLLAHKIHQANPAVKWALLEARSVLGGRLLNDDKGRRIDLGGAWIWPHHQPHMKRLLKNLPVQTFLQPGDPSSTRVGGGAVEIVNMLAASLPKEKIHLDSPVTCCTLLVVNTSDNRELIRVDTANGNSFFADTVVMAAPPKLVSKHVSFHPPLSAEKQSAMSSSHTWMAGVTKVALVYSKAFWEPDMSNMGLPRNHHHQGPAFQMYDASTVDGSVAALTFFALVPSPRDDDKKLADQIVNQLATVWSYYGHADEQIKQLQSYTAVHVQRWPEEKYISEDDQPTTIHAHPHPVASLAKPEWEGRLLFAGSETDQQSPGVMEGAVGAAQRVFSQLQARIPELAK